MGKVLNLYIRYRKQLFVFWTVVFSIFAFLNFYFLFEVTYRPNDECIWSPTKNDAGAIEFVFRGVKFEGVSWNAGIRDGDVLLEINGKNFETAFQANRIILEMDGNIAEYKVRRNDEVFTTNVEIKRLVNFFGLAFSIFSVIWLFVAFVVVLSKPQGETQIVFYRLGAAFVLFSGFSMLLFDNGYNPLTEYPALFILFDTTHTLGFTFLPILFLHFFWLFPIRQSFMKGERAEKILYTSALALFLLITLAKAATGYSDINRYLNYTLIFRVLLALALIATSVVSLIYLFRGFLKIKNRKERVAVFIILIAYSISLIAIVYSGFFANLFASNIYNNPEYFMPVVLIGLLPISFGFSIFRYSLMDISDVIKNTILYGIATIIVAGIYYLIIYLIGQELSGFFSPQYQGIIAGFLFILFALMFQSTKDKLQDVITEKFYPEQFSYQKVLLKFSNEVGSIVGLNKILDYTSDTFVDSVKTEKFAVLLRGSDNTFSPKKCIGCFNEVKNLTVSVENLNSFIEKKRKTYLPVVIEEEHSMEDIFLDSAQIIKQEKFYTIIPLIIKDKVIGMLFFGLKRSGSKFSGSDLDLLTAVSNQVAVALENARLYESEAEKLKIYRDLENARKIQESLLPQKLPKIPGIEIAGDMISAMQVGGDYYDVVKVSDDKFFVVIGDVSGKGLAASFYMSKLETMVKLFCTSDRSPKEVLSIINRNLTPELNKNWFITVSVALFDIKQKTINVCRAGHTPLLLVKGHTNIFYQPRGIGVGLDPGKVFEETLEEQVTHFEKDEIYVFFSDGISEGMNKDKEFYGEERLLQIISENSSHHPTFIKNKVISDLGTFSEGMPQHDDITLVLVKVIQ